MKALQDKHALHEERHQVRYVPFDYYMDRKRHTAYEQDKVLYQEGGGIEVSAVTGKVLRVPSPLRNVGAHERGILATKIRHLAHSTPVPVYNNQYATSSGHTGGRNSLGIGSLIASGVDNIAHMRFLERFP